MHAGTRLIPALPTAEAGSRNAASIRRFRTTVAWGVGPLFLAVYVFLSNHVAVLAALSRRPAGARALITHNNPDVLQHLAWITAFRHGLLLTDYHAPWATAREIFNPLCLILGRLSAATRIPPDVVYTLTNFAFYIFAAYALVYLIRSFVETKAQFLIAALAIGCSVPLKALLMGPAVILGIRAPGALGAIWAFTSDGFLHGGVFLVTLGSALVFLAFAFLARFLTAGSSAYLAGACITAFASALFHPFEAFVVAGGGAAGLALAHPRGRKRLVQAGLLGGSVLAGLAPHVFFALRGTWMVEVARLNRWHTPLPWRLLAACGLPTLLALAAIVIRRRAVSDRHILLRCWFLAVLVGMYLPWLPWSQHLFCGFQACVGLLAAQELRREPLVKRFWVSRPGCARAAAAVVVLMSVAPYALVFWAERDPSAAITRTADAASVAWMRANADPESLVLAEHGAAWYATVPMHSFASHWLFSIKTKEQKGLSDSFFRGAMDPDSATRLLRDYGIRYVVAPVDWPFRTEYLAGYGERARFSSVAIYEFPGRSMKPYAPVTR
jgi:hypothetical protein